MFFFCLHSFFISLFFYSYIFSKIHYILLHYFIYHLTWNVWFFCSCRIFLLLVYKMCAVCLRPSIDMHKVFDSICCAIPVVILIMVLTSIFTIIGFFYLSVLFNPVRFTNLNACWNCLKVCKLWQISLRVRVIWLLF